MKQIAVFIALGAMLWFGFDYLLKYAEPQNATLESSSPNLTIDGQRVIQVFRFTNANVRDGDSIQIVGQNIEPFDVRLASIDAPEWQQPFGNEAKQYLESLLGNREIVAWQTDTDRYGRRVAFLFIEQPGGRMDEINAQMIRAGYAWHYSQYSNNPVLERLQEEARSARLGLWNSRQAPVPPWAFRNE